MGWGRILLLGCIGQLDIHEASRELDALRSRMRADGHFDQVVYDYLSKPAGENAELKLYLAALIQLLITRNIVVPDELKTVIENWTPLTVRRTSASTAT